MQNRVWPWEEGAREKGREVTEVRSSGGEKKKKKKKRFRKPEAVGWLRAEELGEERWEQFQRCQ